MSQAHLVKGAHEEVVVEKVIQISVTAKPQRSVVQRRRALLVCDRIGESCQAGSSSANLDSLRGTIGICRDGTRWREELGMSHGLGGWPRRRCHLRAKCSRGRNENSSSHDISAVVVAVCWGDSLRDWVDSLGIEDASEELKARRMLGWVFAFTKSILLLLIVAEVCGSWACQPGKVGVRIGTGTAFAAAGMRGM